MNQAPPTMARTKFIYEQSGTSRTLEGRPRPCACHRKARPPIGPYIVAAPVLRGR